ncbi:MAG TPA: response regulator [Tepidisphaeraceae bacterium]|jgi:DNA-binding response OmpR family regulator|nr:response regulator [Tepidisphaeraceae bacterium]
MHYKPRILVAEDDPASQDMLVRRLTSRGFRVAAVSDGPACLRRIETELPDLVLLDVQMPGMNGLDVLRHIREHFTHDGLPVIMVTALGESEDIVNGLNAGANDYVVKPVNLPVLLARMYVSLKIKFGIGLLMEAERQRVIVEALKETCHQLAQPMTAMTITLDGLIRHPPTEQGELQEQLQDVLKWAIEVGDVIHRLQRIGTPKAVPYVERLEMFDGGAEETRNDEPGTRNAK